MSSAATLAIVDVGHGNSSVLIDDEHIAVIDAGRGSSLLEYLHAEGVRTISLIVVSHSDEDHLGGVLAILASELFQVGVVCINADGRKTSKIWDDLKAVIEGRHIAGKTQASVGVFSGKVGHWKGPRTDLDVVAPTVFSALSGVGGKDSLGKTITTNAASIVLRVLYKGTPSVLLCGDMEDRTLADMERVKADMTAPILVFPHHGGRIGSRDTGDFVDRLLANTKASTVLFSNGRGQFDNPRPDVVAAVRERVKTAYIACTQISERCSPDVVSGPEDNSRLIGYARGKEGGKSCAGSIRIDLDSGAIPSAEAHVQFVRKLPSPMCEP